MLWKEAGTGGKGACGGRGHTLSEYGSLSLQLCFLALYWARAALRPLITSQHLHLTVSREEDLLCSRPQAGGINGLMTLILSRAGAIRSLAARWIDQVCPSESKRFVYKSSRFCPDFMRFLSGCHAYSVRIHRECCPNRNRILSALHAAVVRSRIERCPFFMRLEAIICEPRTNIPNL